MKQHIEVLSARAYYRRPTPGTVVLVNGQPTHFTGKSARADVAQFLKSRKADGAAQ